MSSLYVCPIIACPLYDMGLIRLAVENEMLKETGQGIDIG